MHEIFRCLTIKRELFWKRATHSACWVSGSVLNLLGKRWLWRKILSICCGWSWRRRRNAAVAGVGFPPPSCLCIWEAVAGISAAEELRWHPKSFGHSGEPSLHPVQVARWRGAFAILFFCLQSTLSTEAKSPRLWAICVCGEVQRCCGQSGRVGWF